MKKKPETSKIILFVAFLLVTAVTIDACLMMHLTMDASPLTYLVPAAYAVLTAATSFYYWKAKNENKLKIKSQAMKDMLELKAKYNDSDVEEVEQAVDALLEETDNENNLDDC